MNTADTFNRCTEEEQNAALVLMLQMIEARRRDEIKFLMGDPKQLAGVPLSRLQEVAAVGIQDAHTWLIETFPQITDVLISLECLTAFTVSNVEPSANDLRDVVTSLEDIWKVAGGKYDSDILADSQARPKADRHAAPGRPESKGTRESVPSSRSEITTAPAGHASKARRLSAVSTATEGGAQ